MKLVQHPGFVQPYPQEALGGELGLTSEDIARSLGVAVSAVNEKCRRIDHGQWSTEGFQLIVDTIKSTKVGRPGKMWVFSVHAAKLFLSRWDNEIGRGYFRYLLQCEDIVENKLPAKMKELQAKFDALQTENKSLRTKLDAALVKRRRVRGNIFTYTYGIVCQEDIFGGVLIERRLIDRKAIGEMSGEDHDKFAAQHSVKVLAGLTKRINEILERQAEADDILKAVVDQLAALSLKLHETLERADLPTEDISRGKVVPLYIVK
jgi:cell division protein FtsB